MDQIRAVLVPAGMALVIAPFASFAFFGQNGLFALGDYRAAAQVKTVELRELEAERGQLRNRVALLDPRRVDPDYADELVRRETGQVRKDEVIIPIR